MAIMTTPSIGSKVSPPIPTPQQPKQVVKLPIPSAMHQPVDNSPQFINNLVGVPQAIVSSNSLLLSALELNPDTKDLASKILFFCNILGNEHSQLIRNHISRDLQLLIYIAKLKLEGKTQQSQDVIYLLEISQNNLSNLQTLRTFFLLMMKPEKKESLTQALQVLTDRFKNKQTGLLNFCSSDSNLFTSLLELELSKEISQFFFDSNINYELKKQFLLSPLAKIIDSKNIQSRSWNLLFINPEHFILALKFSKTECLAAKFMLYYQRFHLCFIRFAKTINDIEPEKILNLFEKLEASNDADLDRLRDFIRLLPNMYDKLVKLLTYCPTRIVLICDLLNWEYVINKYTISQLFDQSHLIPPFLGDFLEEIFATNSSGSLNQLLNWNALIPSQILILLKAFCYLKKFKINDLLVNLSTLIISHPKILFEALNYIKSSPQNIFILFSVGSLGAKLEFFDYVRLSRVVQFLEDSDPSINSMTRFLDQFHQSSLCHHYGIGNCIYLALQKDPALIQTIFREAPNPGWITCCHLLELIAEHPSCEKMKKKMVVDFKKHSKNNYLPSSPINKILLMGPRLDLRLKRGLNTLLGAGKFKLVNDILKTLRAMDQVQLQILNSMIQKCIVHGMIDHLEYIFKKFCLGPTSPFVWLLINNINSRFPKLLCYLMELKTHEERSIEHTKGFLELIIRLTGNNPISLELNILIELYFTNQEMFKTLCYIFIAPARTINQQYALMALQNGDLKIALLCLSYPLLLVPGLRLFELKTFFKQNAICFSREEKPFYGLLERIATTVVSSYGVINTDLLQQISESNALNSLLFDKMRTRIANLISQPELIIAIEELHVTQQYGHIGVLTRATLGICREDPLQQSDLVRMVLMTYLYCNHQAEAEAARNGMVLLEILLDNNPLQVVQTIKALGNINSLAEPSKLKLMPPRSSLDKSFRYKDGLIGGAEENPIPIFQMVHLMKLAAYFNIPEHNYILWVNQSIAQCCYLHSEVNEGFFLISQKTFTEQLAAHIEVYSNLKIIPPFELTLFELQMVYLSFNHNLLTRSLEELLISNPNIELNIPVKKYWSRSAEDLLEILFEYAELNQLNKSIKGQLAGSSVNFRFDDPSLVALAYAVNNNIQLKEYLKINYFDPSKQVNVLLQIEQSIYNSICKEMEAAMPPFMYKNWIALKQIPRQIHESSLGNTRQLMYENLSRAAGTLENIAPFEIMLDNLLFSVIERSIFKSRIFHLNFIDINSKKHSLFYSPMTLKLELWSVLENGQQRLQKIDTTKYFRSSSICQLYSNSS